MFFGRRRRSLDPLPFVTGLGLILSGLALRRWRPDRLSLPGPDRGPRRPDPTSLSDVARQTREVAAAGTPPNVTTGLARSLMVAGAGLLLVRGIEAMEDNDLL